MAKGDLATGIFSMDARVRGHDGGIDHQSGEVTSPTGIFSMDARLRGHDGGIYVLSGKGDLATGIFSMDAPPARA